MPGTILVSGDRIMKNNKHKLSGMTIGKYQGKRFVIQGIKVNY